MPSQIFAPGEYTFSGVYFTTSGETGSFDNSDIHDDVTATIDGWKISFNDPNNGGSFVWDYDFTWGNPEWGFLILGSTSGAYHIIFLGDQKVDWSKVKISYPGAGQSRGPDNRFTVTVNGVTADLYQDDSGTAPDRYTPCYLAGSKVSSPKGLIPVEQLNIGDEVYIFRNSQKIIARVVWCGTSTVRACIGKPLDLAEYPIIIEPGALDDQVPFEPLRITAEHCLCIDDKLIPARMLVNGHSIRYDTDITEYSIYHFMTGDHAIIEVNGALSETLCVEGLGNWRFDKSKTAVSMDKLAVAEGNKRARPLDTSRHFVEGVFTRIIGRCRVEHTPDITATPIDTGSEDVTIVTDCGDEIYPVRTSQNRLTFQIDGCPSKVMIKSSSARPCDQLGPFVDDRRELGILVRKVIVYGAEVGCCRELNIEDTALKGWNMCDVSNMRWTRGCAELRIPHDIATYPFVLSIEYMSRRECLSGYGSQG